MKILITGITGLIGHHVKEVLFEHGLTSIRGHYFSNRDVSFYTSKGIEMIQADICREEALHGITAGCETVVHSAARVIDFGSKEDFYAAHYDATDYLLKDAFRHNVKHFIYVSSVGVASGIDRNKIIPDENTPLVKTGIAYDDAKIDTEILVQEFCQVHNMTYTIVRPSAVIGKGSVWVHEPLKRADSAVGLRLIDDGKHPACLLDARNLAHGIYLCITKDEAKNQIYYFMDDWDISWKQYFTDLAAIKNKPIKGSIPFKLAFLAASIAEVVYPALGKTPPLAKKSAQATGTNRVVSTEKAKRELGWKSVYSYEDAMQVIRNSLS